MYFRDHWGNENKSVQTKKNDYVSHIYYTEMAEYNSKYQYKGILYITYGALEWINIFHQKYVLHDFSTYTYKVCKCHQCLVTIKGEKDVNGRFRIKSLI